MTFPRVLIVAMGRINAADTANNGLLLRNIFGGWPRESLAQLYSSGDNGDDGFFGHYYRLGPEDRRLGRLFYRLKGAALAGAASEISAPVPLVSPSGKESRLKTMFKRLVVESGFYEIVFRPRLSGGLRAWVAEFRPDIVFAQGYCLTFAWLPVLLARECALPIAYYPTDDWPNETYRAQGQPGFMASLMNRAVSRAASRLAGRATVRLAFNRYMQEEYLMRYGREFSVLMHGDDHARFRGIHPIRSAATDEWSIVATGVFNENRLPLLEDLDQACAMLNARGMRVRATVYPVNRPAEISAEPDRYRFVSFAPCPDHDGLAAVLRGADILFLPERFDGSAEGIRLSVSSKAHLFMFSERPIIVYSDPVTGIARYAEEEGWAAVVSRRDPLLLADAIDRLATDEAYRQRLVAGALTTAGANHELETIRTMFRHLLTAATSGIGSRCES